MRTLIALSCLCLSFTIAVGGPPLKKDAKDTAAKPDIRGTIEKVTVSDPAKGVDVLRVLRVGGPQRKDTTYDKAIVRVTSKTKIEKTDGKDAQAGDLKEGDKVEVWFTGPVARSYPPQATADRAVLVEAAAEKK